jgi:hypothetical protein
MHHYSLLCRNFDLAVDIYGQRWKSETIMCEPMLKASVIVGSEATEMTDIPRSSHVCLFSESCVTGSYTVSISLLSFLLFFFFLFFRYLSFDRNFCRSVNAFTGHLVLWPYLVSYSKITRNLHIKTEFASRLITAYWTILGDRSVFWTKCICSSRIYINRV